MEKNHKGETLETFTEPTYQQQTSGRLERLVKTFPWLDSERDWTETEVVWLKKCSDCLTRKHPQISPNGLSTRMLKECYRQIMDGTLPSFKLKWGGGVRCAMAHSQLKKFRGSSESGTCVHYRTS